MGCCSQVTGSQCNQYTDNSINIGKHMYVFLRGLHVSNYRRGTASKAKGDLRDTHKIFLLSSLIDEA